MPDHKCTSCQYTSTRKNNLTRHMIKCQLKLKCEHCEYLTKSKDSLIKHLQNRHNVVKDKVFNCNVCAKFSTNIKSNLKRHAFLCKNELSCAHCLFTTTMKSKLLTHMKKIHPSLYVHQCRFCNKHFAANQFVRHLRSCGIEEFDDKHLCDICGKIFKSTYYFKQHSVYCKETSALFNTSSPDEGTYSTAIKGLFSIRRFNNFSLSHDFVRVLREEMKPKLIELIQTETIKQEGIKWFIVVNVSLYKPTSDDSGSWCTPFFNSPLKVCVFWGEDEIELDLEESFSKLDEKLELFCALGSGWIYEKLLALELHTAKNTAFAGSSWLPTPKKLRRKVHSHCLLNIENKDDEECFLYCVLAAIFNINSKNPHDYLRYKYQVDRVDMSFPVEIKHITKFEKNNVNLSISVFGYENKELFPLRISNKALDTNMIHINLLLITRGEMSHYILIRDKNRLFRNLIWPHVKTKIHVCDFCLNKFRVRESFEKHIKICSLHTPQVMRFPEAPNHILSWKSYNKKIKRPVVVYADFETYSNNNKFQASSYAYVIVDDRSRAILRREHRAPHGVVQHFFKTLFADVRQIERGCKNFKNIIWTPEDRQRYLSATHCHICEQPFDLSITDSNDPKSRVADHVHFEFSHNRDRSPEVGQIPGRLRGAAHRNCNASYQQKFRVPVFFHNLKNFDGHLLIKEIGTFLGEKTKFRCIAQSIEKYISFSIGNCDFLDSMQFLNESLETLALELGSENMRILRQYYPIDEQFNLLSRKGIFPYSYVDCYARLEEKQLPPADAFFNDLTNTHISVDNYEHAQTVWRVFDCSTLGEYQDLYNFSDVCILGSLFEKFRSTMLENYGLDPTHYVSLPSYAWDSMLKMTSISLELLTDPNMYLMFEAAIRGGVSVIPTRYAEARTGESHLFYIDANNLYGASMSGVLPQGDFKFVSETMFDQVMSTPDDAQYGFLCEVDLLVPPSLHDYFNDFPLAPTHQKIDLSELSPYQKKLLLDKKCKYVPTEKLVTTLHPKQNYILHYHNLKLYIRLGLQVTKVHRILQFTQSAWMKPFIDFNTRKRAESSTKFTSSLYKLCSNAVFGRSLLQKRSHKNFVLINSEERARRYIRKTTFRQFTIFEENLVGVLLNKTAITLNSPIYVGMVTLDIAKLIMYKYYYEVLKPKFGNQIQLCFSDTDSLMLHLSETPCLDAVVADLLETMDTSNYPKSHPLYSNERNKMVGKFKDESPANPIVRFVGLRAKMYAYETADSKVKTTAKGIPNSARTRNTVQDYMNTLFTDSCTSAEYKLIRSRNHTLGVETVKKIALSPFDSKRYILPNKINTLAFGHCGITSQSSTDIN